MPPTPFAVEGIRDGDYRLAPDGPGDEPSPGKTYRPDYPDLGSSLLPEPGTKYEVPWVRFGANGLVVEDDNKAPVVPPGYLTVLTNGNCAAGSEAAQTRRLCEQRAAHGFGGVDRLARITR